jgi:hypothetical protein
MSDERQSDGVHLREAGPRGRGVFASQPLARGEVVLVFGGPRIPTAEVSDFTHTIQVGPGHFLGPSREVDDYVNHSCEPNCTVRLARGEASLVALRDLAAGEEITFDYGFPLDNWVNNPCRCGTPACAGFIVSKGQRWRVRKALSFAGGR